MVKIHRKVLVCVSDCNGGNDCKVSNIGYELSKVDIGVIESCLVYCLVDPEVFDDGELVKIKGLVAKMNDIRNGCMVMGSDKLYVSHGVEMVDINE